MREIIKNRGLDAALVGFAVGLTSQSVEKVLSGNSKVGSHCTAVKRYLSIPNAVNVGGRLGVRRGAFTICWTGSSLKIAKSSMARDSFVKLGRPIYVGETEEGKVYSDGDILLLRAYGQWWQPTNGGIRIYETAVQTFYELIHL